jgi:hypothetical protein
MTVGNSPNAKPLAPPGLFALFFAYHGLAPLAIFLRRFGYGNFLRADS